MLIKKIYVSSFGKLKDFTLELTDGVNTIENENGWGKSTLSVFIKAMFYGLNDTKKTVNGNERRKYRPWGNDGLFGGYLEFLWGDKTFRIERFFGQKASFDTVRLFDVDTGKEYSKTEDLGKRIFEIDEEGFLSTTFFTQKNLEVKSNTSVTAKFNENIDDESSSAFDKAVDSLEENIRKLKTTGDRGRIPDIKREILTNETKIQDSKNAFETVKTTKEEIEEFTKRLNSLKSEEKHLEELKDKCVKRENVILQRNTLKEYKQRLDKVNNSISEIEQKFNGKTIDSNELDIYTSYAKNLAALTQQENAVKDKIINTPKVVYKRKKSPVVIVAFILGILISVMGMAFIPLINTVFGIVLLVIGLGVCVVDIVLSLKKSSDNKINAVDENQLQLQRIYNEKLKIKQALDEFLSGFIVEKENGYAFAIAQLKQLAGNMNLLLEEREQLKNTISAFKIDSFNEDLDDVSLREVENNLSNVKELIRQTESALSSKKASVVFHEDSASQLDDFISRKEELRDLLDKTQNEFEILSLTKQYLLLADENLKVKYRTPLENGINKYLQKLSDKRFNHVKIDVDMNISVEENGEYKELDYYSIGNRNLIQICVRFALIDVLFTKEKPFIVLDDPFSELDQEKVKTSLQAIKDLSQEYQIIYFVCHNSRVL